MSSLRHLADFVRVSNGTLEKIAAPEQTPSVESGDEARRRRLAEMFKKREHTSTDSGSVTPTPPEGS